MAKIAIELEQALALRAAGGGAGGLTIRGIAGGDGWKVQDVICTSGPEDRPFQESHSGGTVAVVVAGTFQYRGAAARELMTPGSLVLGNAGQSFECGHEHGAGDRCISFWYAPEYFERLAFDSGDRTTRKGFKALRLPPLRETSALIARACSGLAGPLTVPWEELSIKLAALAVQVSSGLSTSGTAGTAAPPASVARVTRIVREIERRPGAGLALGRLAHQAGLSPYYFLRTFQSLTGLTPHRYVLRARLRQVAMRLAIEPERVIDIALDSGFGDVSNFNRAFRAEFGVSPRAYRRQNGPRCLTAAG